MANEVFIPINRTKMVMMTVIYSLVGLACFFITYYYGQSQEWASPIIFKVVSVVILIFFAIVAGTFGKNIKNKSAGLYINFKGIDDQSSSISHGFIFWKDITGISKVKTGASKYILVSVKKPNTYIDNAKNSAIKRLLHQNLALYKTPVVINVGALSTSLNELEETIANFAGRFGNKQD